MSNLTPAAASRGLQSVYCCVRGHVGSHPDDKTLNKCLSPVSQFQTKPTAQGLLFVHVYTMSKPGVNQASARRRLMINEFFKPNIWRNTVFDPKPLTEYSFVALFCPFQIDPKVAFPRRPNATAQPKVNAYFISHRLVLLYYYHWAWVWFPRCFTKLCYWITSWV